MNFASDVYPPGTQLTVGTHQVVVDKYFSKGGFAQVYTCTIQPAWKTQTQACLKRVMVPDKPSLVTLRKEVDAMRKLQGLSCIVSYIDSHAARSRGNSAMAYEVFVLMEYCPNKGLIDYMNTRLVNKLKEPEILSIMEQITEGVAHMHALNPPLIHRDIKIENVLIDANMSFKLCDFGSVSTPIQPPKNIEEFKYIQDDILRNTTPQYRSPEMLDLYKNQPIDEKSDIWALGVFLYKLCYYTSPFEKNAINNNLNVGYDENFLILHGMYSLPPTPAYSPRLKNMISKLLVVNPSQRPTVFQLLEEICNMRGKPYPQIKKQTTTFLPTPISTSSSVRSYVPVTPTKMATGGGTVDNNPTSGFKYNALKQTLSNTESLVTTNDPVREITSGRSRRPLSLYNKYPADRSNNRDNSVDIINFMNELSTEEVVKLSPDGKKSDKKTEFIPNALDYIKSLSRQNTNQSMNKSNSTSKSKKRSSITSIKNLLTGGSTKSIDHTNDRPSHRSSLHLKRNTSVDSLPDSSAYKPSTHLADLKEMSPEGKKPPQFESIDATKGSKRSIHNRIKTLFNDSNEPKIKTASGYGKYTDNIIKSNTIASISPAEASHKVITKPIKSSATIDSATTANIVKSKKPPPPKPKKPAYLRSTTDTQNEDFDALERRFERKFVTIDKI